MPKTLSREDAKMLYLRTLLELGPDPVLLKRMGEMIAPGGLWVVA